MAYLYGHGLGPYFQDLTVKDIKVYDAYFTLHFDETVTKQAKKQLDVLLRFWSTDSGYVKVRYLTSLFYGHAFAEKVSADLIKCLENLKLPVKRLLSISSDGPNVNKSIKAKLEKKVNDAGSQLVDVGFCFVHMIHNAFKKGTTEFRTDAIDLTQNVFQWFYTFAAREEDFAIIQVNENCEKRPFLRHVDSLKNLYFCRMKTFKKTLFL